MKLPFFKPQKPEPKPTMSVFVPQRTPPSKSASLPPTAPQVPAPVVDSKLTVPVSLKSIIPQMPRGLLLAQDPAQLARTTVAVPASMVVSQLATGKVVIPLAQLAALLPANLVNQAILGSSGQQSVLLPLAEVIAAIPPEALVIQHESEVSLDMPELAQMPGLFEPPPAAPAPQPPPAPVAAAPIRVAPVPTASTAKPFRSPPDASATVAIPVPPPPPPKKPVEPVRATTPEPPPPPTVQIPTDIEIPANLRLTVGGLITGIPDDFFVCPKADLGQRTNLKAAVEVPVEPLLPQLQKGRITLPTGNVIDLLPREILAQPLPATDVVSVPLPLNEIIPQLPPQLFTAQLSGGQMEELEALETDIPAPFQERAPRLTVQPPPAPAAPTVEEAPEEVTAEELVSEETSIFTEKKPAAVAVPTPAPERVKPPVPLPVTEVPVPTLPLEEPPPLPTPPVEPVVPALVAQEEAGVIDEKKFLIDLNRCSVEDLVRIPGVGRTLAQRVIDFRNNRGQFTTLDELRLIPGIGRKTFRALTGAEPRSLNRLLGVDDARELTLQEIVKLTSGLPGVDGCMLAMADGLFLTGQLPAELDQEAISVFAPQLFKRVGRYVKELKVGAVSRFTIFTEERPISVFHAGDVYLVVIHDTRHFSKKLLRQCERISQEIARLCQQRTVV